MIISSQFFDSGCKSNCYKCCPNCLSLFCVCGQCHCTCNPIVQNVRKIARKVIEKQENYD
jgi:hypothetical protein